MRSSREVLDARGRSSLPCSWSPRRSGSAAERTTERRGGIHLRPRRRVSGSGVGRTAVRAVRRRTRRRDRRRLPAGDATCERQGALDLPGRRGPPSQRSVDARSQHRDDPGWNVLHRADGRLCGRSTTVAVRLEHDEVLPLVLAPRRGDGRRRPGLRVPRRDVRARPGLPHTGRAGIDRRRRHRHRHDGGRGRRVAGEPQRRAVRLLHRVRQSVDVPLRPMPSAVRVRPVHLGLRP